MGLRGTMPEMEISDDHYPATYLASLYNTAASVVSNQTIYNEDFVNAPNLQKIYLIVDNEKIAFEKEQIKKLTRTLHLKTGLFHANAIVTTKTGKEIALTVKKIANMQQTEQYSLQYAFMPLNFSGTITLVSEADGDVYNYNVARYRSLTKNHLDIVALNVQATKALLVAKTKASQITVTQYSELFSQDLDLTQLENTLEGKVARQKLTISAKENTWYTLDKTVSVAQRRKEETPLRIDLDQVSLPTFEKSAAESAAAYLLLHPMAIRGWMPLLLLAAYMVKLIAAIFFGMNYLFCLFTLFIFLKQHGRFYCIATAACQQLRLMPKKPAIKVQCSLGNLG